jgi:hypothetical protein
MQAFASDFAPNRASLLSFICSEELSKGLSSKFPTRFVGKPALIIIGEHFTGDLGSGAHHQAGDL